MYDTAIQYYLHIDPSQLTDEDWAKKIAQLKVIRIMEQNGK